MIDKNTKFQVLNQKVESLEKIINKIFLIIFILPIIFLLLKFKVIEEINLNIFSIKQINLILSFFPTFFSLLILISTVYINLKSEIIDELNYTVTNEKELKEQLNKENWLKYLNPNTIIIEILGNIKAGGCIGCFGVMIVYLPMPVFIISYIIGFFIYYLNYNFIMLNTDLYIIALSNMIFSIWIISINIIYFISKFKKNS